MWVWLARASRPRSAVALGKPRGGQPSHQSDDQSAATCSGTRQPLTWPHFRSAGAQKSRTLARVMAFTLRLMIVALALPLAAALAGEEGYQTPDEILERYKGMLPAEQRGCLTWPRTEVTRLVKICICT